MNNELNATSPRNYGIHVRLLGRTDQGAFDRALVEVVHPESGRISLERVS